MLRRLKQHFCDHYFILETNQMEVDSSGYVSEYVFKCSKCQMTIKFPYLMLEKSINNTLLEYANLKRNYLDLIKIYRPYDFKKEMDRLFKL